MITRVELYRLVWTEPASSLASKFGVSNSYFCRVLTALDVPRPPRGYWGRRSAGQEPPIPGLPPLQPGCPDRWSRNPADLIRIMPFYKTLAGHSASTTYVEHPLVAAARTRFEAAAIAETEAAAKVVETCPAAAITEDRDDAADAARSARTYLKLPKRLAIIDVTTSRTKLADSLDLADKLYRALEARGHRVAIAASFETFARLRVDRNVVVLGCPLGTTEDDAHRRPTVAYVASIPIGLAVVEVGRQTKLHYAGHGRYLSESHWKKRRRGGYSWSVTRWLPTGLLKIVAYSPFPSVKWRREWTEPTEGQLAALVDQIVADIEQEAKRQGNPRKSGGSLE